MQIAIDAGKREVVDVVSFTMDRWNNVLNVERRPGRIILMQVAILASVVSALLNVCSNLSVDHRANW